LYHVGLFVGVKLRNGRIIKIKIVNDFLLLKMRSTIGRNIIERWFPAIRYNGFRTSPIFTSIGAKISKKPLLGFYYAIDESGWSVKTRTKANVIHMK
jgi:hypothetical protein